MEQAWTDAERLAKRLGREHAENFARHRDVAEAIEDLKVKKPRLNDENDHPRSDVEGSTAIELERQLAELPGVEQAVSRARHAQRIADAAEHDWKAFADEHGEALLAAQVAEDQAVVQELHDAVNALIAGPVARYGERVNRALGVVHNCRRLDTRQVQGSDNFAIASRPRASTAR